MAQPLAVGRMGGGPALGALQATLDPICPPERGWEPSLPSLHPNTTKDSNVYLDHLTHSGIKINNLRPSLGLESFTQNG
jgi:hypothetical protein